MSDAMSEEALANVKKSLDEFDLRVLKLAVGRGVVSVRSALETSVELDLETIRRSIHKLTAARLLEPFANRGGDVFEQFRPTSRRRWLKQLRAGNP
jgi:hypothetical protein